MVCSHFRDDWNPDCSSLGEMTLEPIWAGPDNGALFGEVFRNLFSCSLEDGIVSVHPMQVVVEEDHPRGEGTVVT